MAEQNIKKLYRNRVGMEDITTGTGTETQTRNGQAVTITKVNASLLPYDDTQTLQDVYDDIKAVETNVNEDREAVDARLDAPQSNSSTVEENIETITSEPVATQLANAETNATNAQLEAWNAEAEKMTANSYAVEAEDVFVKIYTSNGDGTFSYTNSTEYSSFHWKEKSAEASSGTADNISYDNTNSNLVATDVQAAIEEVEDTTYTKTALDNGQLDTRYYTETEVDAEIEANKSISQVASSTITNMDSVTISDTVSTNGFSAYLHTGNGGTQDIENGIDFVTSKDYSDLMTEKYDGNITQSINGGTYTDNLDGTYTVTGNGSTGVGVRDGDVAYLTVGRPYFIQAEVISGRIQFGIYNDVFSLIAEGYDSLIFTPTTTNSKIYISPEVSTVTYKNVSVKAFWEAGTYNTDDEVVIEREGRTFRVVCLQDGVTSDPNDLFTALETTATTYDSVYLDWEIDSQTNGGMVSIKSRLDATNHFYFDTLRGVTKEINSNTTDAEAVLANSLTSFNVNGYTLDNVAGLNTNTTTDAYASWSYQTTHVKSSLTSHGKPQIEEYNPITGFTMIKYKGSGTAGHEIAHSQGRELGLAHIKNTNTATNWISVNKNTPDGKVMILNNTIAETTSLGSFGLLSDSIVCNDTLNTTNASNDLYIAYAWANAIETDEGLQGNFEIGIYQGTGVAGNKITTKGKPLYVMVKRLDGDGSWHVVDSQRPLKVLILNSLAIEDSFYPVEIIEDGFIIQHAFNEHNTSGSTYLYKVIYDNDSGSGKSKYDNPTDTSNLTFTNSYFNYTAGITDKGYILTSRDVTKTVDTSGVSDGLKWISENSDGSNSDYDTKPSWSWSEVGIAFNTDGQWYNDNVIMGPTPSFMQNPVLIENGIPQYIDYSQSLEVNYMESLNVDKLVTRNNRKILEIGTIYNNNRYVIDWKDVFTNYEGDYESYDVRVEIKVGDTWTETGFYNTAPTNAQFTNALSMEEGVVIQTGYSSLGYPTAYAGGAGVNGIGSSAPARIIVTYHGRAKNV